MQTDWPASAILFCLICVTGLSRGLLVAQDGFRFAADDRFEIEQVADDRLASDIWSLAIDGEARVYVSGPGYIRRLVDDNGDGVFERAVDFAAPGVRGCQGMVFHGDSLWTTGGRGLERYRDADRDGVADAEPELLLPLSTGGEHGSHALRIGPDGKLWFLGGNYCGLAQDRVAAHSPWRPFYAGVFCRMSLDAQDIEVWAQGMRNAYDFDFTPTGDAFGWDSDSERDDGLAWYRPCRVYRFTPGADCGWRSIGSGKLPNDAIESTRPVAEVHRGSPTGVACYRHRAFPARYFGGLFLLNWTHGNVYFVAPRAKGATFSATPEEFLSTDGRVSFAPTDVEVTPDGALLITSGGRGIQGSVWRVSSKRMQGMRRRGDDRDVALEAESPLSAWSRTRWMPAARRAGAEAFLEVLEDCAAPRTSPRQVTEHDALRALEILVELFSEAHRRTFALGRRSLFASVRAATTRWSADSLPPSDLLDGLRDENAMVRRTTAEAIQAAILRRGDARDGLDGRVAQTLLTVADDGDRALRRAAASALAAWRRVRPTGTELPETRVDAERIARGFADLLSTPRGRLSTEAVDEGLAVLRSTDDAELTLDALRVLYAAFDRLKARENPKYSTFDDEWDRIDLSAQAVTVDAVLSLVELYAFSTERRIAREALRLAGRLGSRAETAVEWSLLDIDEESAVADDFWLLWLLARFEGNWSEEVSRRLTSAGLQLPRKVRSQSVARDKRWPVYQRGTWERHLAKRPDLGRLLLDDPNFGLAEHLELLSGAPREVQQAAAATLLEKPPVGDAEAHRSTLSFLRKHVSPDRRAELRRRVLLYLEDIEEPIRSALRADSLQALVRIANPEDRTQFSTALTDEDPTLVPIALRGLTATKPADGDLATAEELTSALRWAHVFDLDRERHRERDQVIRFLQTALDADADGDSETNTSRDKGSSRRAAIDGLTAAFLMEHPEREDALNEALRSIVAGDEFLDALLERAPWNEGDAERGRAIFAARSCGSCHRHGGRGQRVGPDLAGVGKRYAKDRRALLVELVTPSRNVPARYRVREYVLKTGEVVEGLQVYAANDVIVTVTRQGNYRRFRPDDVFTERASSASLMPSGLLDNLTPGQVADLVRFLEGS